MTRHDDMVYGGEPDAMWEADDRYDRDVQRERMPRRAPHRFQAMPANWLDEACRGCGGMFHPDALGSCGAKDQGLCAACAKAGAK